MKRIFFISTMLCFLTLFSGCEKDSEEQGSGTISVKMRTWNNYATLSLKNATENATKSVAENVTKSATKSSANSSNPITLQYIDMKGYKYEMKVTTDDIREGGKEADIKWVSIYKSSELKEDSKRDFEFTLPAGTYKGFALWQGRDFFWIGDYNGNRIEIPASNGGESNRIFNVFGIDGLYGLNDNGEFIKVANNEKIGVSFKVNANKKTTVTIRTNFTTIDWYDNDNSGSWSSGDEAGDPDVPSGISTMADFIIVYE